MRAAVAPFVPRALAGIMGVDREGGYAIPFLTRVGGDHARWEGSFPTTRFALPIPRGSHALGGIACASWTRILSIIPYSVRAESMTSLFTFELRLTTLSPAGSENHFILEGAADGVALVPRGQGASEWQLSKWQRVAYAPSLSRTVRRGRIELEAGHIRAGSVT